MKKHVILKGAGITAIVNSGLVKKYEGRAIPRSSVAHSHCRVIQALDTEVAYVVEIPEGFEVVNREY